MHRMFYSEIDIENAGKLHGSPVIITGAKYPVAPVDQIAGKLDDLFQWVKEKRADYHPVEFAAQLHKRFVFIHPLCGWKWSYFKVAHEHSIDSRRLSSGSNSPCAAS